MFYTFIKRKRDAWFASASCTVQALIDYMKRKGALRDVQIDAIRTYLFLKIAGGNRSLYTLLTTGFFNSYTDAYLDELPLSVVARNHLKEDLSALALYEFANIPDSEGKPQAPNLKEALEKTPDAVDSRGVLRQIFGGLGYTEYLFNLPMGAGKTYLMAAFIYLDLYFTLNEPRNPAFAHNFLLLVPSGLKTSVIPSLRTIQRFDPSWVLPPEAAAQVKRRMVFEVLDADNAQKKSNQAKNPNVQKIARYSDDPSITGLVLVTNAEKVILDRLPDTTLQMDLFESRLDAKDRQANELRNRLGRLPHLAIFVDEAHHAASADIKLRQVISRWQEAHSINMVIGFSGTPYLKKAETIPITDTVKIKYEEIPTIAHAYPLIDGIGNFLKQPTVMTAQKGIDSHTIIRAGLQEFFRRYKDLRYEQYGWAKVAIFCSNIEALEAIYPEVVEIVRQNDLDPQTAILRFYRETAKHKLQPGASAAFASLDTELSPVRVLLLVEIGKEGWDCRSLTSVILSQKGACPLNKVLQTSCRCLRQVEKGKQETALIYLNEDNEKLLRTQLKKQHHLTLDEFQKGSGKAAVHLSRYDRTAHLHLPPIHFFQLAIQYAESYSKKAKNIDALIRKASTARDVLRENTVDEHDLKTGLIRERHHLAYGSFAQRTYEPPAQFVPWLGRIVKESFGTLTLADLRAHETALRKLFGAITEEDSDRGYRIFRPNLHQDRVRAHIRCAFAPEWHYEVKTEKIATTAHLLYVENFTPEVITQTPERYYPDASMVNQIMRADKQRTRLTPEQEQLLQKLQAEDAAMAELARAKWQGVSAPQYKDRSFHYLPYHTDSDLEIDFLKEMLPDDLLKDKHLELYYNGDGSLTEFHIRCYHKKGENNYRYVGSYTPDFLVLQRESSAEKEPEIRRVLIIETKGKLYGRDPAFQERRAFMETEFKEDNKSKFDYLYLEDRFPMSELLKSARERIQEFFK